MGETQIKSCPHCGGSARLNASFSYKKRKYFVFVKCDVCGAQAKAFTDRKHPEGSGWDDATCKDALAAWNLRCKEGAL